jgi:protoporphyrin/coproporphyrin ferrochelatase
MNSGKSIAVVLFQLGGPDSLEAIEPFLLRLFRDPDIIDFPFAKIAREPLARIISATRAKKVRNHYAEIGGRSPILEFTRRQARALEDELSGVIKTRVFVAMRYWHPLTEEAVRAVEAFAPDELVLLPLYPQYSKTTTGSSLNEWNRQIGSSVLRKVPTRIIREFYSDAAYLHSLSTQIEKSLSNFSAGEEVHLVFSAHSVPVSVIERGDPYQAQIESTVERLLELGGWRFPHTLCYQSKVGASKWLQPSLHSTLKALGERRTHNVLVVPVAFVSDHVETLSEINIEAREEAAHHGIRRFELMPGLNDDPSFIRALAGLVLGEAVPRSANTARTASS